MRKLAVLVTTLFVASFSFAGSSKPGMLSALANSWKANQTSHLQPGHDINIVYGGEDVEKSPVVASTAIA